MHIRMMKTDIRITFLMLLAGLLLHNDVTSQNIRGDTIYVDENNVVRLIFKSLPGKAELADSETRPGLYEVKAFDGKSLAIKALKKDADFQALVIPDGDRNHLFLLAYKDGSPARSIDLSTKKKRT